ncbi:hypothetical protein MTR_4g103960 [Medicago truncatula]|uniref:Uncharacterized protein n=1 Tax=Medicago truncatula TaxID=3880 RepID=G7JML5_MEDTR|nr:hypothetical protein MTR_4g103960 [Medicago truncatula]
MGTCSHDLAHEKLYTPQGYDKNSLCATFMLSSIINPDLRRGWFKLMASIYKKKGNDIHAPGMVKEQ